MIGTAPLASIGSSIPPRCASPSWPACSSPSPRAAPRWPSRRLSRRPGRSSARPPCASTTAPSPWTASVSDEAWQTAEPVTDFVMKEPTEGGVPTDDMEVRFAYDDGAFYIGARMSSRNSPEIQAPLGRRDNVTQAEHILVALDTFLDRRTSVVFGVSASGVRIDRVHATDTEETFDLTFDLVWRAAARQEVDGWTAEIWIPLGAAPLQSGRRPHLGSQHPALPADAERAGHLGADPAHRAGLGVVVRRPARADRPDPVTPPRGLALRGRRRHPLSRDERPATRSPTGRTWSAASAPTSRWASARTSRSKRPSTPTSARSKPTRPR